MLQSYLLVTKPQHADREIQALLKKFKIPLDLNSPDISIIEPLKKITTISQVRAVKSTIFQKPISLSHKVVVFKEAHSLNKEAQNALLKILEEPPRQALVILVSSNHQQLLPTIISRVGKIYSEQKDFSENESILEMSEEDLLTHIPEIENPASWLEDQLGLLTKILKDQVKENQWKSIQKTISTIENCQEAKKMIESNVSPQFVLSNLALSSNQT